MLTLFVLGYLAYMFIGIGLIGGILYKYLNKSSAFLSNQSGILQTHSSPSFTKRKLKPLMEMSLYCVISVCKIIQ